MPIRRVSILAAVAAAALVAALGLPGRSLAQSPSALGDEDLLALVLPPGPGGTRPPVHMWARADQARGPGGYPTVFVVTMLTVQGASGPEEHEVINYVQYSDGGWAPARPQGDGTLLLDDWAWISQNLTNLTAVASGSGSNSNYTVDYSASGPAGSGTRQIAVEEVYGADLSLLSSTVLSDTGSSASGPTTPATGSIAPGSVGSVPSSAPPIRSATPAAPPPSSTPAGGNTIRLGVATPTAVPGR